MKTLVIAILLGNYLLDLVVEILNFRSFPEQPEMEKRRSYLRENLRNGFLDQAVQLAFWILAFQTRYFEAIDQWTRSIFDSSIWQGAFWLIVVSSIRSVFSLPFQAYSTFSIEARYGFNTTTIKTFILDRIKGAVLGLAIGAPILAFVLFIFTKMGTDAWWISWAAMTVLSLAIGYLAPAFILPLFNKFSPLLEGELRREIEAYAGREHFPMGGTFIMDGSKRSTKRNAFFTGFGKLRKLVLFDTLVSKHTTEEIMAVVAHEMGHFKLGHIPKMIAISVATQGLLFWILGQFLASPNAALWVEDTLGLSTPSLAGGFLVISLLYLPISRVLSIGVLGLSRKHEYEADAYSKATYGKPEALIEALRKMETDHLSHPSPHWLKVLLEYSHPPVAKRAEALKD
jgi:STE24 endopeptidase